MNVMAGLRWPGYLFTVGCEPENLDVEGERGGSRKGKKGWGGGKGLTTRAAADIHAEHDADAPSPGDGLVVALTLVAFRQIRVRAQQDLGHASVAEEDHDEGAHHLHEGVAAGVSDALPEELVVLFVVLLYLLVLRVVVDWRAVLGVVRVFVVRRYGDVAGTRGVGAAFPVLTGLLHSRVFHRRRAEYDKS